MYINILVSIATVAVISERTLRLYFTYNIHGPSFLEQVEKLVLGNNLERAVRLCGSVPDALLAQVVKASLIAAYKGKNAVTAALEERFLALTPLIKRRVQTMWSLANVGTLVGLIGTIFGLIAAFGAVGVAAPEQKTLLLTRGISEALNNTAFGLSIAVTNIIGHMFLSGQSKKMIEEVEHAAVRMEILLASRPVVESEELVAKAS